MFFLSNSDVRITTPCAALGVGGRGVGVPFIPSLAIGAKIVGMGGGGGCIFFFFIGGRD